jgi:hypothetical protein
MSCWRDDHWAVRQGVPVCRSVPSANATVSTDLMEALLDKYADVFSILIGTSFDLFDQFRVEAESLPEVVAKRKAIEVGTADPRWSLMDGMVVHKGRLFMPSSATTWHQVLAHAHGVGHEGVQKTLQRVRTSFSTPGDNKLVREFIRGCAVSQRNKTEHLHLAGLLQHSQFHVRCGLTSQWISSKGFPKLVASQ